MRVCVYMFALIRYPCDDVHWSPSRPSHPNTGVSTPTKHIQLVVEKREASVAAGTRKFCVCVCASRRRPCEFAENAPEIEGSPSQTSRRAAWERRVCAFFATTCVTSLSRKHTLIGSRVKLTREERPFLIIASINR